MMDPEAILELWRAAAADPNSDAAKQLRPQLLAQHAAGQLTDPTDAMDAARLLIAGGAIAELEAAERLALAAMRHEPAAKPLAAHAFDLLRKARGQPQKFGTVMEMRDGQRHLWPVDPHTTDSERAKWGLPTLAEFRSWADVCD
jgi:hypothetical protein